MFILSHSKSDSYQQLFEFKKAIFIHHRFFYFHIHGLGFQNLKGIYMPNYENRGIYKF